MLDLIHRKALEFDVDARQQRLKIVFVKTLLPLLYLI